MDRILSCLTTKAQSLECALGDELLKTRGIKIPHDAWAIEQLDPYYQMNYRIVDVDGSLINEGQDLIQLKNDYAECVQQSVHADNAPQRKDFERTKLTQWSFGALPKTLSYQHQGMDRTGLSNAVY